MLPWVFSVIDHRWRQIVVTQKCVNDVLTTFWRRLWFTIEQMHGNMKFFLFYIITKQTTKDQPFLFQNVSLWWARKKPFDVIYCLYKMKQSQWLLCVAKNWVVQESHTTVKLNMKVASRGNENLQWKQSWTVKIYKCLRKRCKTR